MSFQLRAIDRTKVYDSVVDQILKGIRSGAFPPGGVLPPERMLAAKLGVSRGSVREAIRVLEHAGIVDVRIGSGTYVTEGSLSKAAALRARAALLGEQSPLDIMVARRALEPVCAEHAATNRHPRDIDALSNSIETQAQLIERGEDVTEVDLGFHVAVASACHNPLLVLLMERVAEIMRQGIWGELKNRSRERHGNAERYLEHHRAILEAIRARDPAAAAEAMRAHLDAVEEGLLAEVDE